MNGMSQLSYGLNQLIAGRGSSYTHPKLPTNGDNFIAPLVNVLDPARAHYGFP